MLVKEVQEAYQTVGGGGGFHVAKLLRVHVAADGRVDPVKYEVFTNQTGDGGDCNWP